ncbi:MAG: transaldolase family protein [Acidobacteria bacterium]|nr:transaldolase family protein [Acidobacteriota bacterium]
MATGATYKGPLHQMTQTTPTCLWSDSADLDDLEFAIANGAVGATCNPVIAHAVLKEHPTVWRPRIADLVRQLPTATEDEIGWAAVERLSVDAARLLLPAFEAHQGRNGRLSIQTDPRLYRDAQAILKQAEHFHQLAPNVIVKIPATRAGIRAMEEATLRGISVNATVCFSVSQAIGVAEAIERGLKKRESGGHNITTMGPVCTIMVGRLDDWLKVVMEKEQISTEPGHLDWAGVAVFKKAYRLFQSRSYRTRLLSAAFRNVMHWSELIGGDIVISPPPVWQKRFVASDIEVISRITTPVPSRIADDLYRRFPDFRRAFDENALAVGEFDSFPPTRRTLRQFLGACGDLNQLIRDVMLPNPDGK